MSWWVAWWAIIFVSGSVAMYVTIKNDDPADSAPRSKRDGECPGCLGSGYSALMMACHTCGGYGTVKERR